MKLTEMTFEQSHIAEMKIVPLIEKIMSDKGTAKLFDDLFATGDSKSVAKARGLASKTLAKNLTGKHFNETCQILSILNDMPVEEIKKQQRSDANKQIFEMFGDMELISFFMSPEALDKVVQSAT